jgi:fermentation-respiration switch protein FrsA (DUF1100 family)
MTGKRFFLALIASASATFLCVLTASSFYLYHISIERKTPDLLSQNLKLAQTLEGQAVSVLAAPELPVAEHLEISTSELFEDSDSDLIETNNSGLFGTSDSDHVELSGPGWVESQPYDTWTITSGDGLALVGYYIPARMPTTKTVILAHGYGGRGMEMGQFAKFYWEKLGYNVLLPDARGHGASEGAYIGFGWPDRKDYLLWIQKIIDWVGYDSQIALHGLSMGGATVMMASGETLPEQVKVIVEDSGYTSVYDEFAYQLKRIYKLPAFPLIPATSLLTDIKAGYHLSEASSLKQVAKNKTPMLFIHGVLDTIVPTEMALKLYDACKAEKELYLAENAGHGMAFYANQPLYEKIVTDFVDRYIYSPPAIY